MSTLFRSCWPYLSMLSLNIRNYPRYYKFVHISIQVSFSLLLRFYTYEVGISCTMRVFVYFRNASAGLCHIPIPVFQHWPRRGSRPIMLQCQSWLSISFVLSSHFSSSPSSLFVSDDHDVVSELSRLGCQGSCLRIRKTKPVRH